MNQQDKNLNRLSERSKQLLMELFAFGESSVGDIVGDFEVSETTLHRSLQTLEEAGYVRIRKVRTPGQANSKKMYSLSELGGKVVHDISVDTEESKPIQEFVKEQGRRISELENTVEELEERLNRIEHHVTQGKEIDEAQGFEHVSYIREDESER